MAGKHQIKFQALFVFNADFCSRIQDPAAFIQKGVGFIQAYVSAFFYTLTITNTARQDRPVSRRGVAIVNVLNNLISVSNQPQPLAHGFISEYRIFDKVEEHSLILGQADSILAHLVVLIQKSIFIKRDVTQTLNLLALISIYHTITSL